MSTFKFKARWKEELVCTGPDGAFVLELPMGVLSAYLPTEEIWKQKAPLWACELWPVLRIELEEWCIKNKAEFIIDSTAELWPQG